MSAHRDDELEALFSDQPDLLDLAQFMRSGPHPAGNVEPSPQFRQALRRELMRQAWERQARPSLPWWRRLLLPTPGRFPLPVGAAAVAAVLVVFLGVFVANYQTTSGPAPVAQTNVENGTIKVAFSQPMDQASVESAVRAQSSNQLSGITYSWSTDSRSVTIRNVKPNTTVTVAQTARSQSGQPLATAITVSAPPTPTPTPTPKPTPTPSTNPLISIVKLLPTLGGPGLVGWSPDGAKLYGIGARGQLLSWPAQAGAATILEGEGVTVAAVDRDGTLAYVHNGQLVVGSQAPQALSSSLNPLSLGFSANDNVLIATPADVRSANGAVVVSLGEHASRAEFSPQGDRLAYLGATSGELRMVDLTSAADAIVGPAHDLGDWAPDGHRYAYPGADGAVWVADARTVLPSATPSPSPSSGVTTTPSPGASPSPSPSAAPSSGASPNASTGPNATKVTTGGLSGITDVSWSSSNQLLLATSGGGLWSMTDRGGALTKLADGLFSQVLWAPAPSGGTFAVLDSRFQEGGIGHLPSAQATP